jgi:nucleoside-diphosphate-sugar epimerase
MQNTYSITRTTAERFTLMYAKEHGVEGNVVRALNAYGARQTYASYKKMVPGFVLNALAGKPLKVYGDGTQQMDFIYVSDLAKCLVSTLLEPEAVREATGQVTDIDLVDSPFGNVYQCGAGFGLTVSELAQKIISLSGSTSHIEYV